MFNLATIEIQQLKALDRSFVFDKDGYHSAKLYECCVLCK